MYISDNHYIYAIRHNHTKKIYIGCSKNSARISAHMSLLKNRKHKNKAMLQDRIDYGFKFTVYLLEIVQKSESANVSPHDREMFWIHYYCTDDPEKGYNSPRIYKRINITSFPKIKDLNELDVTLKGESED